MLSGSLSGSTGAGRESGAATTLGQPEEWYLNCLLEFSALRPHIFFAAGCGECSASRLP